LSISQTGLLGTADTLTPQNEKKWFVRLLQEKQFHILSTDFNLQVMLQWV